MTRRAAAIGECLVDLIAPAGGDLLTASDLHIREGGAPANVAVALARLGVPSRLHAVVGDDPFGERLRRRLADEGVDTGCVRVAPGVPTTIALAWADERGNGHFRLHRHADVLLAPGDVDREALAEASVVIAGSVAMAAEPSKSAILTALAAANALGIPVVVDLNIRPGLVGADEMRLNASALITAATVVKLSVDDAQELWGATSIAGTVEALARFDPPMAVITDGSRGAALRSGGKVVEQAVFPVDAVEPTGAGDAFTAAFISRMLDNGWSGAGVDDLRFAMAAGALATTRPGAMDGLPSREQVLAFLAARQRA
jgi:fructokinase